MPAVVRKDDQNNAGGLATSMVIPSVLINDKPCAVVGTIISSHSPFGPPHPPHEAAVITVGNSTVLVEGKPIAYVGSPNSCGHSMATGSPDVMVG